MRGVADVQERLGKSDSLLATIQSAILENYIFCPLPITHYRYKVRSSDTIDLSQRNIGVGLRSWVFKSVYSD
jgi:hypothetical protein